jgi:peptidoglycan hydrolase CwlO-like protein
MRFKNAIGIYVIFTSAFIILAVPVSAQTPSLSPSPTLTPTPAVDEGKLKDLQNKIKEYEGKITELQGTKKTLNSQIAIIDNQVKLSELKISDAQVKIVQINGDIEYIKSKISSINGDIEKTSEALVKRIAASYKLSTTNQTQLLLSSDSFSEFYVKLNYSKIMQGMDKRKVYAAEQNKVDYANQRAILEDKQKEEQALKGKLEQYTSNINNDKKAKQSLLSATSNDEAKYQRLLQDARAQISAFKSFTSSKVGSGGSVIPAQASPDGWYYNQRDERWGRNNIGTSKDQMWEVGCLATSVAMVMKQKGVGVTPADVASSSSYYFADTASMLIPWAGGKFQSIWQKDFGAIDAKLAAGEPIIVGVKVTSNSVGTHFLVLKSGSNGDYIMNDPWEGANLKFSDYYSTSQIFQYGYYKG